MSTSNLEIKIKALVEGLDGIAKLTAALNTTAKEAGVLTESSASASKAIDTMAQDVSSAQGNLKGVGDTIKSVSDNMTMIASSATYTGADLQKLGQYATQTAAILGTMASESQDASKGLQQVSTSTKESTTSMNQSAGATTEQSSRFKSLVSTIQELVSKFTALNKSQSDSGNESQRNVSQFSSLGQKLRDVASGHTDLTKSATATVDSLVKVRAGSGAASEAMGTLISVVKPLAVALMAVAGVKITFDYLKDAAQYAAKVQTLGTTLNVVGQNAGYSNDELSKYETNLKKLGISTEAARNSMIQMMQAGLGLGAQLGQTVPQVEQLARAAQDLAVVTGENSSDTMQRLITNIQQMDTMGMRFMGLSVDMTAAQQKFATSIGTTAGALTDAQKRQAVMNEALAQAQKLAGSYEAALGDVAKQVGSMDRYSKELANSMGEKLLPIYGSLVKGATDLIKSLTEQTQAYDEANVHGKEFGDGVSAVMTPLVSIISLVYDWVLKLGMSFGPAFKYAGEAVGTLLDILGDLFQTVDTGSFIVSVLSAALQFLGGMLAVVADATTVLRLGVDFLIIGFTSITKKVGEWGAALSEFLHLPDQVTNAFKDMAKSSEEMGAKSAANVQKMTTAISDGKLATLEWAAEFDGLNKSSQAIDPKPFDTLADKVRLLTKAQNEHSKTSVQVAESYTELKAEMDKAKESGQLSEQQYAKLASKLGVVGNAIRDELDGALKQLNVTSSELATGISEDSGVIIGALSKVKDNGIATADQFSAAFSEKVTVAKNIQELNEFSKLLDQAKTRWPESANLFADAQKQVAVQFDELYDKQVKTVSTTQQWNQLKAAVEQMGAAGIISGNQVEQALAKGEQQLNRMSPAFQSAASASKVLEDAVQQVEVKLGDLNSAIQTTATQAQEGYSRMAAGYSSLAETMRSESEAQLVVIDQRYARESALIDNSVLGVQESERRKAELLVQSVSDKMQVLEDGALKEQQYLQKEEDATRASLAVKLAALDSESVKLVDALGKNKTNREAYEQRLKDLDAQRKQMTADVEQQITQKKEDALIRLKGKYTDYINKLADEEDRRLQKVKAVEEQIASLKMTAEERLRNLEKQGMSDYEAYQANQTDVATYQAKARAAAAAGEYDKAKEYMDMAKDAASNLNQAVQEGDKVYVTKQQAMENTKKAMQEVYATELALLEQQKSGYKASADAVHQFRTSAEGDLDGVNSKLSTLQTQAKQGVQMSITADSAQAEQKVTQVQNMVTQRELLMSVKADLKDADTQVKALMDNIEKGRTSTVKVDTEAANTALTKLFELANQTANPKLALDATNALKALDDMDGKIKAMDGKTTHQTHDIQSDDHGTLQKIKDIEAHDKVKTSQEHDVNTNAEDTEQKIYKITSQDGKVTYSDHNINTNADETGAKIEAVHTSEDNRVTTSEIDIKTNAEEAKAEVDDALKPKTGSANIDVTTNAKDAKAEVDAVTTKKEDVTNKVNVDSNAKDAKTDIDKATEQKPETKLKVTIESNAKELEAELSTLGSNVSKTPVVYKVSADVSAAAAQIRTLNSIVTQSVHRVSSNYLSVLSQIQSLNGQNTSSYHTIYMVRQFLFAEGGEVDGGSTGPTPTGGLKYHHQSSGTIGGAGNSDSEARTLDVGSFVLRKSAVQKYGAGNLLNMIEKAKNLPKMISSSMGKVRAMTMPGEIVVGRDVVSRLGTRFLSAINGGAAQSLLPYQPLHFAEGGAVGFAPSMGSMLSSGGAGTSDRQAPPPASSSMTVDLRSDNSRATVSVAQENVNNLLDVLAEMQLRT